MNRPSLVLPGLLIGLAAAVAAVLGAVAVANAYQGGTIPTSPDTSSVDSPECMNCHGLEGLPTIALPNGDQFVIQVDSQSLEKSVHANKLICTDCHRDMSAYPHPARQFRSAREFTISQYESCKRCHFSNYTKALDSVHYQKLSLGDLEAPVCTDCHGSHDVSRPDQPRSHISGTCSECHGAVYDAYARSIHGDALVSNGNIDVPVCTDCHQVHNIQDPLTPQFHVQSVQICSGCHGNKEMMSKYGISTNVATTYLQSFHGMSVFLSGEKGDRREVKEPVCTDCHGVHDIQAVTASTSPVLKANLSQTCAKCHVGAAPNFPDSWIGHYEPSLEKQPAVFLIQWFYRLLIPFILGGLGVHILLDLWRIITNR